MAGISEFLRNMEFAAGAQAPFWIIAFKTVAALFGAWILWLIIRGILGRIARRQTEASGETHEKPQLLYFVGRGFLYGIVLLTGTYLIDLLHLEILRKSFYAILIVLISFPARDLFLIVLKYAEQNIVKKTQNKVDDIVFDLLNRFAGVIIFATAAILALDVLGINVMPFIAGAGVAGIAIGFAAKDTLSNLIAGVLLLIDRPFEIGDRIEVWSAPAGSASWGDVVDIGLRATKIRTTDNIIIIIPNNEIMKRDIVNYTIISNQIRVRINIGISYDANTEKAKKAILQVAASADWISKTPAPKVVVRNFGESSVDLQLRVWIDNARKRMDTISYVTDHVKEAFDAEGIEIPYPKRDIHLIQSSKENVSA
jgi:small-conductance mechanosensitive channel